MSRLLMPMATAVWLVDNTALTFDQIADLCELHTLEVKGIADGDVASGIKGMDPVSAGQLSREEISKGENDADYRLKLKAPTFEVPETKPRRRARYTPVSKRQDRPDAIYWLVRNHPEMSDGQIIKLLRTTKATISSIRDRTHWNSANIKPVDPVSLGLCSQIELDEAVRIAAERKAKENAKLGIVDEGEKLMDVETSLGEEEEPSPNLDPFGDTPAPPPPAAEEEPDADSVFAKLNELKTDQDAD